MIYLKGLIDLIPLMVITVTHHWRGKEIILLNDWIQLRGTPYALEYFPDDFDEVWAHIIESEIEEDGDDQKKKWHSDYLDLMEYKRNPNYGKSKCFHCLLSPDRDDPIFIGIIDWSLKD